MNHCYLALIATVVLALQGTNRVDAGCCERCGATCTTRLICRTICTTKIVESSYWDEQCETICMPPKSLCVAGCTEDGCTEDMSCDTCDVLDGCDDCSSTTPLLSGWSLLFRHPGKCRFRDRSKLVRKSYVQYVPKLECVVQELCTGCCGEVTPGLATEEPNGPATQPEPPAEASAPVRLQISDQLESQQSPAPSYIDAGMDLDKIPPAGEALVPIAPVIHILSR